MNDVRRTAMPTTSIHAIDRLDFSVDTWRWPFAEERGAEIARHFAALRAQRPRIWNGRVLMMRERALSEHTLRGTWFETSFAGFLAWRDWGCPDASVTNCFAMGALRAADGAFLLGVMGAHTANAGKVYFAAGTPDLDDLVDGRVDLAGSVSREVEEETGLTGADYTAEKRWHAVVSGARMALMKVLSAPLPADALRARVLAHLAREDEPELADIRIVRGPVDLDPMMPEFVKAFLMHTWRREADRNRPDWSELP